MSYVLGFWALGADIGVTGGFGIDRGIFSHWQSWLALAGVLNLGAIVLNRYGHRGIMRLPGSFFTWVSHFGHRTGDR